MNTKKFTQTHVWKLLESKTKTGKTWEVVLIETGKSENDIYYPADVLKRATHLFEGARACAYKFGESFDQCRRRQQ